jgi:FKBP-type peptidyl-prolyl cis-trans isomerase
MTRRRDRFFAGFGAMLFLITASAFTILVIVTLLSDKDTSTTDATKTQPNSCEQTSVSGEVEAVPEVYKAPTKVKALESTDIKKGTGAEATQGSCIQVKYYGTLAQNGKVFDENYDKAELLQTPVGAGQLIPGWDQGILGMKEGGIRRLVIPAAQAYGDQESGAIPANSDLVFMVKLVSIKQP